MAGPERRTKTIPRAKRRVKNTKKNLPQGAEGQEKEKTIPRAKRGEKKYSFRLATGSARLGKKKKTIPSVGQDEKIRFLRMRWRWSW